MCGIAGYFGARVLPLRSVDRMLEALRPRGPDAENAVRWTGEFRPTDEVAPNGLLATRLSIIDPRPEAAQPMTNTARNVWVSYNGEVYDWMPDAKILMAAGYRFRTHSDTEFILHAYEHWGMSFVERLRGMFAIAIVDFRNLAVYVVRDRIGLKPVVYAHRHDGFAFASTVRALLPWVPSEARTFSPEGIDAYLAHRTIPAPRTVFAGMQRLAAAHYLHYELQTGRLTEHEYWRPAASTEPWQSTFDDAIRMRTVADRPLGLFLSSGIDSTAVACRLASMRYSAVPTITAGFPGTSYDESADARMVADRLRLQNISVDMPSDVAEDFPRIVADLDEPFADPSSIPMWYLARESTRQVKVVLSGTGGDELFAGYKRYAAHLRTGWRKDLVLPTRRSPLSIGDRGWRRLIEELRLDWRTAYVLRFSAFSPNQRILLEPDVPPRAHYWRMPDETNCTALEALLEIDRLNYLPEYILRKDDLCTMAHGLELRAPFLDHRFVACIKGLPLAARFTKPAKMLLAAALAPIGDLDPFARKKRGFNPPIERLLKSDLAKRLEGLGKRLAALTNGQVSGSSVDLLVAAWRIPGNKLSEQVLQLLILDESLQQLAKLAALP
jgi:asparagine synthase (glutamine-hydrolysing)